MMDRLDLVDASRNRQYLLEKTQHIVGGFGKGVGEPPGKIGGIFPGVSSFSFINGHQQTFYTHISDWCPWHFRENPD